MEVEGEDLASGERVRGYEMHIGVTAGAGRDRPLLRLADRDEGAVSADGKVLGSYLHGLFSDDGFRRSFLARIKDRAQSGPAYDALVEGTLDRLADHLEDHLDLDRLLAAAARPAPLRTANLG